MKTALTAAIALTAALGAGVPARALASGQPDTVLATASAGMTITRAPGKPFRIDWGDGKEFEAVMMIYRSNDTIDRVPLDVAGSTCGKSDGGHCQHDFRYARYLASLLWKRHPSRSGLPVEARSSNRKWYYLGGRGPMDELATVNINEQPIEQINCSDYSWLPQLPGKLPILTWNLQVDGTNPETGQTEKHLETAQSGGFFEVQESGPIGLQSPRDFDSSENTWLIYVRQSADSVCELSMKLDFDKRSRETDSKSSGASTYLNGQWPGVENLIQYVLDSMAENEQAGHPLELQ